MKIKRIIKKIFRRKRAKEKLNQQNEYMDALHETALGLMNRLKLNDLLEAIVSRAGALLGTPHGFIYLAQEGEAEMVLQVGMGTYSKYTGHRLKPGEGVAGIIWQTGQPLIVEDYQTWSGRLPAPHPPRLTSPSPSPKASAKGKVNRGEREAGGKSESLHAIIAAPLKSDSQTVGVIGLAYSKEDRTFSEDEVKLLNRFAELASIALDNARLYTSIEQELFERRQAEEALRANEERLARIVETVADGILIEDLEGRIIFANAAAEKIYGISLSPTPSLSLSLIEKGRKRTKDWKITTLQGKPFPDEKRPSTQVLRTGQPIYGVEQVIHRPDGTQVIVSLNAAPLRDISGTLTGVILSVTDITQRKRAEKMIKKLAYYDALTGLPNRALFNDRLNLALAQASRDQHMLALIFLDLDRFKTINDTLGHTLGDRLLQEIAKRLVGCLRRSDTISRFGSEECIISRLGGDEFTILLPRIHQVEDAARIAQRILDTLKSPFYLDGHELHVTTSLGIAFYPNDGKDAQTLLKNADAAMYQAKEWGRNSYRFYTSTMNARALERLVLEAQLRRTVEREEFAVYYQPQVNLKTGKVVGVEALIRWQHPELGLVLPGNFIRLAEETGLITSISKWVLKTACTQNKAWQDAGLPPLRIAVNLSARIFRQENLIDTVAHTLEETKLNPSYLELELTEDTIMEDAEEAIVVLNQLKEMGANLSIDDFGKGYSSLSYLKRFPIDTLKIDQSFVKDIPSDPDDTTIAKLIIDMAHALELKVIAEGVETEEQLFFLCAQQCDEAQGYLFGQPVPVEEFERLLKEDRCFKKYMIENSDYKKL